MSSLEKTEENKDKNNSNIVRLCGETPPGYWDKKRKEAMDKGIAYYDCDKCGLYVDVCGHVCVGPHNNLCGNSLSLPNTGLPLLAQPQPILQQQQPSNIMIAVPTGMTNDFEWSREFYLKLLMKMCPPNSSLVFENRYGIAQARETLVNTFINSPQVTHLLFFDTDILPIEMHGVMTLINDTLQDQSKYIVSGLYYNSLYSGLNAWINEVALKIDDPLITQSKESVIPVDKVGMGYTIIRKDLFHVLNLEERPLFYYKIHEGNVMESEDFTFFKKLKKYGIRPYIDTRVTAQHIKRCKVLPNGSIQF